MRISNNQPYDYRRMAERTPPNVEQANQETQQAEKPQRRRDHFQMSGDRPRPPQGLGPQSSQSDYSQAMFSAMTNQLQGNGQAHPGGRMAPPDPSQMMTNLDTDGSGGLSIDEFKTGMPSNASETSETDRTAELFSRIDSDGDGNLTQEEIEAGRPQPPQSRRGRVERQAFDPEQMIKNLDSDADGKLSLEELTALMSQDQET